MRDDTTLRTIVYHTGVFSPLSPLCFTPTIPHSYHLFSGHHKKDLPAHPLRYSDGPPSWGVLAGLT